MNGTKDLFYYIINNIEENGRFKRFEFNYY